MPCPDCDHGDECPRAVSRYPQQTDDLLGVNERQQGLCRSYKQVSRPMRDDDSRIRSVRLLHFGAATALTGFCWHLSVNRRTERDAGCCRCRGHGFRSTVTLTPGSFAHPGHASAPAALAAISSVASTIATATPSAAVQQAIARPPDGTPSGTNGSPPSRRRTRKVTSHRGGAGSLAASSGNSPLSQCSVSSSMPAP